MSELNKSMEAPAPLKGIAVLMRANPRLIAYWTLTLIVAWENLGGAIWAFLRIDYSRVTLEHLGYPLFIFNILGPGELCIAVALLLGSLPRAGRRFVGTPSTRRDNAAAR
jgi:hypothetical protein